MSREQVWLRTQLSRIFETEVVCERMAMNVPRPQDVDAVMNLVPFSLWPYFMLDAHEMWVLGWHYKNLVDVLIPTSSQKHLPMTFTQYFTVDSKYFRYRCKYFGVEMGQLTSAGLRHEIRCCPREYLEETFPSALIAEFTITPNELIVPLSQLEVLANYNREFPLHFPTNAFVFQHMASFLQQTTGHFWRLDEENRELFASLTIQGLEEILPPVASLVQTFTDTILTNPVATYACLWLQHNASRKTDANLQLEAHITCKPLCGVVVDYMFFSGLDRPIHKLF